MKPSPEQFEEWRASPVTEWVLGTFLAAEMARTKRIYQERAWNAGATQEDWITCRERFETLQWVNELDMSVIEAAGEQQEGLK